MIRPALLKVPAVLATRSAATLHRRRAPVIVRSPDSTRPHALDVPERRRHLPTLPGLGFRGELDTEPLITAPEDQTPVSQVRARTAPRFPKLPPPPAPVPKVALRAAGRMRPVTLIDDVHDRVSRELLEEAARIVASGVFERHGEDEDDIDWTTRP